MLNNLLIDFNIIIFAFLQINVIAKKNFFTSDVALKIFRCHVYVTSSFNYMLASQNILFNLFLATHYFEISRLITF